MNMHASMKPGPFEPTEVNKRALVLSAGGPLGAAWEIGIVAGLEEAGVVVSGADRIIGTSAGAIVGCQLAIGSSPQAMLDGQIARARYHSRSEDETRNLAKNPAASLDELASAGPAEICRRALNADSAIPEHVFVANFEGLLPRGLAWPERFACVATDARTAERRVWNASSGVDLVRAVASSCCAPYVAQPITLNGSRFLDGGLDSMINADLAGEYESVLIVAVVVPVTARLVESQISRERTTIERNGGRVSVIAPNNATIDAIGPNLMEAARGEVVVKAAYEQGQTEANRLRSVWSSQP